MSYNQNHPLTKESLILEIIITLINPPFSFIQLIVILNISQFYFDFSDLFIFDFFGFNSGYLPLIISLVVSIMVYSLILYIISNNENKKSKSKYNPILKKQSQDNTVINIDMNKHLSEDVYQETINLQNNHNKYSIAVLGINKEYNVKRHFNDNNNDKLVKKVINDVSFGVNKGECFCIVGPKGSGKSTLLDIITSNISKTSGVVYCNGQELPNNGINELSRGYCSRLNTFWDDTFIESHIKHTLKLSGYFQNNDDLIQYVDDYIKYFNLEEKREVKAYRLSRSDQRLLCFIMMLCRNPKFMILDEPTADINIQTKKKIWNAIRSIKENTDIPMIISTNSMKEAQILGDRIGILINGQLVCIGTPEEINNNYCENHYILEVHSTNIEIFQRQIIEEKNLLGEQYKKEIQYSNFIKYQAYIPNSIENIFRVMEKCQDTGLIIDYSFSQLSLEQLYLNYTKNQDI